MPNINICKILTFLIIIVLLVLLYFQIYNPSLHSCYMKNEDVSKENFEGGGVTVFKNVGTTQQTFDNFIMSDRDGNMNIMSRSTIEQHMVPKGTIIMWSGSITSLPNGWKFCDGQNGTPDLRGRFVLGVNPSNAPVRDLTSTTIGGKGGAETHTLTIEEMPPHNHKMTNLYRHNRSAGNSHNTFQPLGDAEFTENTGGGRPHNNMPPYYVLAFLMKTI